MRPTLSVWFAFFGQVQMNLSRNGLLQDKCQALVDRACFSVSV
jgi:hypothetical protein